MGGPYASVVSAWSAWVAQIAGTPATALLTPFRLAIWLRKLAFTVAAGVTFVYIIPWFFVNPDRQLHTPDEQIAARCAPYPSGFTQSDKTPIMTRRDF